MNKFITIGKPEEDAPFILSGLGRPTLESWFPVSPELLSLLDGKQARAADQVFRLNIPAKTIRMTLTLLSAGDNCIKACHEGRVLGECILPAHTWVEFAVDLPGDMTPDVVGLLLQRDPYQWPVRHVFLSGLGLSVPDAGPDGDFPTGRIARYPVRNNSMYRTYHEIRKLGDVQVGSHADEFKYSSEVNTYFGDLHVHTEYSMCGYPCNKTMLENARSAKGSGLDFIAFTDHAEHMDPEKWRRYFDTMDEIQETLGILVIPAFEWTSLEYGHRNIYFEDTNPRPPFFHSKTFEANHPRKLGAFFTKYGLNAIAVGHHPAYVSHLLDPCSVDESTEPLIEIYSTWGCSEERNASMDDSHYTVPGAYVRDLLARGYHFGFTGGGDVHNTKPGDGGLTAVLCPSLTRENVFKALKNRMCYATSGDRILLDFHINGFPMGTVIKVNQYTIEQLFPIHVAASAVMPYPAEKIELIQNGVSIYEKRVREAKCEFDLAIDYNRLMSPDRLENHSALHTANCGRVYYVRVTQRDGNIAWSSPIFIDYRQEYVEQFSSI